MNAVNRRSGRRAGSRRDEAVLEHHLDRVRAVEPHLLLALADAEARVAVSMMNAEMPLVPLLASVRAVKVMYFATLPFVM
jgi:hypothetical protein